MKPTQISQITLTHQVKYGLKQAGYYPLSKGAWIYIDPEIIPHNWHSVCDDFEVTPNAKGAYLAVMGIKEVL
jgi:hypothetical protein